MLQLYLKDFIELKIANAVSQFQNSLETQQKFTDTFLKMSIYDSKYPRPQNMKIPNKKRGLLLFTLFQTKKKSSLLSLLHGKE